MANPDPTDITVGEWLADLASGSATPGGGAAAAIAGACGAALIAMTSRLTVGRKGLEDVQDRVEQIAAESDAGRATFLELARKDAEGFEEVMAAFKMPKGRDRERAARSEAIQRGYANAAEAPLEIARLSVQLLALAEEVARIGNPAAVSDACSAAAMLAAASIAAAANVRINASAIEDVDLAVALEAQCEGLETRAEEALTRTRDAFVARIGR